MNYAQMSSIDAMGAGFTDAKMVAAYLDAADLSGAKLDGVVLEGCLFDDLTKWPSAFIVSEQAIKVPMMPT